MKKEIRHLRANELLGTSFVVLTIGIIVAGLVWYIQGRHRTGQTIGKYEGNPTVLITVHLESDGTVQLDGQRLPARDVVPLLRRDYPTCQLHILVLAGKETLVRFIAQAMTDLSQDGVTVESRTE